MTPTLARSRSRRTQLLAVVLAALSLIVCIGTYRAETAAAAGFAVRIDTGSTKSYTDTAGVTWGADKYFIGGKRYLVRGQDVAGTADDKLYATQRHSMEGYDIPVPAPGTYRVTLGIAEVHFTKPGDRVFGVTAEGVTVRTGLDAVAAVGPRAVFDQTFDVDVADGVLSLRFPREVQNPQVQAIEVVQLGTVDPSPASTTTTAAPQTTTTTTVVSPPPPADDSSAWKYPLPPTARTIDLTAKAGQDINLTLGESDDVVLRLPSTPISSLAVSGGHNIVIDGGTVVQASYHDAAVQFKHWSGELHVRNLQVDPGGARGIEGDGIRIVSRYTGSTATLQRIRVDQVAGRYDGAHGDILQTWGGPSRVRVWKFTGYSNYQGFYLAPVHFDWHPPMGAWEFTDVDLHGVGANGNTLYTLSGQSSQGDGDFFSAANGDGSLSCSNCWGETPPSGWTAVRGPFVAAGAQEGDPGEFVPAR